MVLILKELKGPVYHGTKTSYNKLHDDKKSYTGVYKNGGPTNKDSKIDRTVDFNNSLPKP